MRYAYLGPEGTFTEAAVAALARTRAGGDVQPVPCPSVGATLTAVRTGAADRAVVPIESSVEGIVTATVDDLAGGGDVLIQAETRLPIEFALLARRAPRWPTSRRSAVTRRRRRSAGGGWRPACPGANGCRSRPTRRPPARSARGPGRRAGVGGRRGPVRPDSARADVHDRSNAMTRFVEVAPPGSLPAPTGADRTSLVAFLADDHAGALMEILTEFAVRGVNLSTIQSRPTGDGLGSYFFFIDCEGHIDDARVGEAMMGVRRVCAEVRFLGSYPRSDGGRTQVRPGTSDPEFAEAAAWLARLRYGRP